MNTHTVSGKEAVTEDDLFEGTPYRPLGELGSGGMGSVYLIEHREMGGQFVAKVVHRQFARDQKTIDRFRLEAQSLGQLDHPHIVSVFGAGTTHDGRPFIVLEYLQGRSLKDELANGPLTVETALDLAGQYLSALDAAHQAGIVHRDFKPANLFVTRQGDTPCVKVLDFGLAKVLPDAPTDAPSPLADPTTVGNVVGTPKYLSPEAVMGHDVDERADVYAAALVLYRSLAGRGPFDHLKGFGQMMAHTQTDPEPPSVYGGTAIEAWLDGVILRALSKRPEARFSSAREFAEALKFGCETGASSALTEPEPSSEETPAESRVQVTSHRPSEAPHSKNSGLRIVVLVFTAALLLGVLAAGVL